MTEWRFEQWDDTTLVVTVTDEDPGDMGEPRIVTDYDDGPTTYLSVRAVKAMTDHEAAVAALREAALEALDKAAAKLEALCSGKERWVMRVPAEPDNDPDLVFAAAFEASRRYFNAAAALAATPEPSPSLREALLEVITERGRTYLDEPAWEAIGKAVGIEPPYARPDALRAALGGLNDE